MVSEPTRTSAHTGTATVDLVPDVMAQEQVALADDYVDFLTLPAYEQASA